MNFPLLNFKHRYYVQTKFIWEELGKRVTMIQKTYEILKDLIILWFFNFKNMIPSFVTSLSSLQLLSCLHCSLKFVAIFSLFCYTFIYVYIHIWIHIYTHIYVICMNIHIYASVYMLYYGYIYVHHTQSI